MKINSCVYDVYDVFLSCFRGKVLKVVISDLWLN